MSPTITRRTLTKGAAWSLPAVVAASTVPAMAASDTTVNYDVSYSWAQSYRVTTDESVCPSGEGQLTSLTFDTVSAPTADAHGFAIVNEKDGNGDESETTSVTISDFTIQVAFPAGMVNSFTVDEGDYTPSGPTTETISGTSTDVFTFTFTGSTTGTTVSDSTDPRPTAWEGSGLDTTVDFDKDGCYSNTGITYYVKWSGTYTTANGVSGSLPGTWSTMTSHPS